MPIFQFAINAFENVFTCVGNQYVKTAKALLNGGNKFADAFGAGDID